MPLFTAVPDAEFAQVAGLRTDEDDAQAAARPKRVDQAVASELFD